MKTCTKCHIEKDESEFGVNRAYKDGKQRMCRECGKARCQTWRDKNIHKVRAYTKYYNEQFREEIRIKRKDSDRKYYQKNKDRWHNDWINNKDKKTAYRKKRQPIINEKQNDRRRKQIEQLSDPYIKDRIKRSYKTTDPSEHLMEIIRVIIKIKRYAKEKKKTVNQ